MTTILGNLQQVQARIVAACTAAGRNPASVRLLAASKAVSADAVRSAIAAGQTAFGENYVQEGAAKIQALRDSQAGAEWHCIGPVQSNKTRVVAEMFDWMQSLDRVKIAERLDAQRPAPLPPLQVCIQVNLDDGQNKSGVPPEDVLELAKAVANLPRLRLRGLMAIPEPTEDEQLRTALFDRASQLFHGLREQGFEVDTLSMGMSGDLESAIAAGSTMVRVGTSIFGQR